MKPVQGVKGRRRILAYALTLWPALNCIFGPNGLAAPATQPTRYFGIRVVDEQTNRGVPLVELTTVNNIRLFTDSGGYVAFDEPGLMDRDVFFFVSSAGYDFPKDGFGMSGATLHVKAGEETTLRIKRTNIAERLYRLTGQGIYRDTMLLGHEAPIAQPLLNAQVLGQDSAGAVIYREKIYWFFGDTNRPGYPLGNFLTSGATSELAGHGGLDPLLGVNLKYFTNAQGFCRGCFPRRGAGPVWLDGLAVVPDKMGQQRLVGHYSHMESLAKMLEHGVCVFNDQTKSFDELIPFDLAQPWRCLQGHPVQITIDGKPYICGGSLLPLVRVRADLEHVKSIAAYEAFTCLEKGSKDLKGAHVVRDATGKLLWRWETDTMPVDSNAEQRLIQSGQIAPGEARFQFDDIVSGKPVRPHGGSINWNEFRKKWIAIFVELGGTSNLGEVWYSEADSPLGPWRLARKIVTHDRYSFYNPVQHPFFDEAGGRFIYFEGTYANTFSGNPVATPRYDYNQIMYRLDLADARLSLNAERAPRQAGPGTSAHSN